MTLGRTSVEVYIMYLIVRFLCKFSIERYFQPNFVQKFLHAISLLFIEDPFTN